jgi:hypothetical protein
MLPKGLCLASTFLCKADANTLDRACTIHFGQDFILTLLFSTRRLCTVIVPVLPLGSFKLQLLEEGEMRLNDSPT